MAILVLVLMMYGVGKPAFDKGQLPQSGGSKLSQHEQVISVLVVSITGVTV